MSYNLCICITFIIAMLGYACKPAAEPRKRDSFLDQDYNLIAAVLLPDSVRDYPQEFFVGRIQHNTTSLTPPAPQGRDRLVNRVILTLRSQYTAEIRPRDDAKVSLFRAAGDTLDLVHTGDGFYRDTSGVLTIEALELYHLLVELDEESYRSSTLVPGNFGINNASNGDTVESFLYQVEGRPAPNDFWEIAWDPSPAACFYRIEIDRSSYEHRTYSHKLTHNSHKIFYGFDAGDNALIASRVKVESIDPNYARMYEAGVPHSGSSTWFEWVEKWKYKPLHLRSSIRGPGAIAGVFGSCNVARPVEYFVVQSEEGKMLQRQY